MYTLLLGIRHYTNHQEAAAIAETTCVTIFRLARLVNPIRNLNTTRQFYLINRVINGWNFLPSYVVSTDKMSLHERRGVELPAWCWWSQPDPHPAP